MNLIELIYAYRTELKLNGRSAANNFLMQGGVSIEIIKAIMECVSDEGEIIDFEGYAFNGTD
jgi:hypothetical protein